MLVGGQGFPKWRLSELERSVNNSIFPVAGRQLMAGSRASPCAPKAALGKSGIGEGLLSGTYPEGQPPANSGRSRIVQDDGLSVSITSITQV
jgi:hypothetical protein